MGEAMPCPRRRSRRPKPASQPRDGRPSPPPAQPRFPSNTLNMPGDEARNDGLSWAAPPADPGWDRFLLNTSSESSLFEWKLPLLLRAAMNQIRHEELDDAIETLSAHPAPEPGVGVNICLDSNQQDRLLAALTIANGTAAMGIPAQVFFAAWGTTVLVRRPDSFFSPSVDWPSQLRDRPTPCSQDELLRARATRNGVVDIALDSCVVTL